MFTKILQVWKNERSKKELFSLEPDFYLKIAEYFTTLKEEIKNAHMVPLKRRLLLKEIGYSSKLIEKIIETRLKKMFNNAIKDSKIEINNDIKEELKIIEDLNKIVDAKKRLYDLISSHKKRSMGSCEKILLRFMQPLQKIVCIDLKSYGPFDIEDIVFIPIKNGELLIKRRVASRI